MTFKQLLFPTINISYKNLDANSTVHVKASWKFVNFHRFPQKNILTKHGKMMNYDYVTLADTQQPFLFLLPQMQLIS